MHKLEKDKMHLRILHKELKAKQKNPCAASMRRCDEIRAVLATANRTIKTGVGDMLTKSGDACGAPDAERRRTLKFAI